MAFSIEPATLELAVSGDVAALDHVLRTITPHVERQLVRYPVSDEDRRDLLQATLMQIVRRLGSFRAESSFSSGREVRDGKVTVDAARKIYGVVVPGEPPDVDRAATAALRDAR